MRFQKLCSGILLLTFLSHGALTAKADDLKPVVARKIEAVEKKREALRTKKQELKKLQTDLRDAEIRLVDKGENSLVLAAISTVAWIGTYKLWKKGMRHRDVDMQGFAIFFGLAASGFSIATSVEGTQALFAHQKIRALKGDIDAALVDIEEYDNELKEDLLILKRLQGDATAEKP